MYPETLEVVKKHMSLDTPMLVEELQQLAGVSRATVYNALSVLKADKHHVGKNQYAYTLSSRSTERDPIENVGTIDGVSWADYVTYAIQFVQKIHLRGEATPEGFIDGFQQLADTFQNIADHVKEVEHRPDWRLVLGLDKEQ